jgi:hypothetical protein
MHTLSPAPADLGLASPALGPWFADEELALPRADQRLAVTLTPTTDTKWLPPAGGLLTFRIASSDRPRELAGLRDAAGAPAFEDGRFVARFRLLPEVEARLAFLMGVVPTLAGDEAAGEGATRPRIRSLALEYDEAAPTWSMVEGLLPDSFGLAGDTDDEKARHLGFAGAGPLANGPRAMNDLVRPGRFIDAMQPMLKMPTGTTVRLWAFDHRGRPVDPGAVACWWRLLATHEDHGFEGLWASGLQDEDRRTAPIDDGAGALVLHLVNAHQGPLTDEELGRVTATNLEGDGRVRRRGAGDEAAALGFSGAPDDGPDDLPEPRMGLLPDGRFGAGVSVWPDGPADPILERDFARVAVLSVERHLVGQPRHSEADPEVPEEAPAARRAADQQRASTRVGVARAERNGLLATGEAAAAAILQVFDGAGATDLVAPVLEAAWGPVESELPDVDPPEASAPPELEVRALRGGGGHEEGGPVRDQRALVELSFDAGLTGAWVRVWTQGFDPDRGEHFRLDGGAGRVGADGTARLVTGLPDGAVEPAALMGLDVLVTTARGHRHFADLRFARPEPEEGDPVAISDDGTPLSGATTTLGLGEGIAVCSTGAVHAELPLPGEAVPSGSDLVALTDPPSLVDPASVPLAARRDPVGGALSAGDRVRLVEPAFQAAPRGDDPERLAPATVHRTERRDAAAWEAGFPLPSMQRLEFAAARVQASEGVAAVGSLPPLARFHEILPHHLGHPGCPAAPDSRGPGVRVRGPGAALVAEYLRDRTSEHTLELIQRAATPIPTPPAPDGAALWAAGLRTVAAGVEGEVGLELLADAEVAGFSPYPLEGSWEQIKAWVDENIASHLDTTVDELLGEQTGAAIASIIRALDRRFQAARWGLREGATSLAAAIGRAEDFVYIETPALDALGLGPEHDRIELWDTLRSRMAERPGLQVAICLPFWLPHGCPAPLQRVRDTAANQALAALGSEGSGGPLASPSDRVAVFSPSAGPGRTLRLAGTTVIVDDAYALVGTTHLWRRGLSFDASYSVAAFDERLRDGRPAEIAGFRRTLLAGRLGLDPARVPDDPEEIVRAIRDLRKRGGFGRLATDRIRSPDPTLTTSTNPEAITDLDLWNRDGSPTEEFNAVAWMANLLPDVRSEELNPAP